MEKKIVKDRKGQAIPANTADAGGGAYAPHNREAEKLAKKVTEAAKLAKKATQDRKPSGDEADERTPEKTIGEISYAEKT